MIAMHEAMLWRTEGDRIHCHLCPHSCRIAEGKRGVCGVRDLHLWSITSGLYALSAHLVIHGAAIGRNDAILTVVKSSLRRRFGIDHTTLQIESTDYAHVDDVHTH